MYIYIYIYIYCLYTCTHILCSFCHACKAELWYKTIVGSSQFAKEYCFSTYVAYPWEYSTCFTLCELAIEVRYKNVNKAHLMTDVSTIYVSGLAYRGK